MEKRVFSVIFLVITIVLCFPFSTQGSSSIDSLQKAIANEKGIARSNTMVQLIKALFAAKDSIRAKSFITKNYNELKALPDSKEKYAAIGRLAEECKSTKLFAVSGEMFQFYFQRTANFTAVNGSKYLQMYIDIIQNTTGTQAAVTTVQSFLQNRKTYPEKEFVSQLLYIAGNLYWKKGILDSALIYMQENLALRKNLAPSAKLGLVYHSIGNAYWRLGKLDDAYTYYSKGLEYHEQFKDTVKIIITLNNLGLIFQRLKYYEYARHYIDRALGIAEKQSNKLSLAYTYKRLSDLFLQEKKLAQAEQTLQKAEMIYNELHANENLTGVYVQFGKIYQQAGENTRAMQCYQMALKSARKESDQFTVAAANLRLGEIFLLSGKYAEAGSFLQTAEVLASKNKYHVILRDVYQQLALQQKQLHHPELALQHFEKYLAMKDSVINEQVVSSINENNTRRMVRSSELARESLQRENALQKQAIDTQKKLNVLSLVIILVITLLLIGAFIFYRRLRLLNKRVQLAHNELEHLYNRASRQNDALTQANATKEKLFSIIAHDLKNPFNSIYGFTDIISTHAKEKNDSELLSYSSMLMQSSRKLVALIDNLSSWSLMHHQKLEPAFTAFDCVAGLKDTLDQVRLEAELKSIALTMTAPEKLMVFADRNMIMTVARNLLINAIKFTPESGSISITVTAAEDSGFVAITDSGAGMSSVLIDAIMNGKNISSTLGTHNEKGSGIGLTVCREFIKINNGSFTINSEAYKGSTFTFSIPLAVREPAA